MSLRIRSEDPYGYIRNSSTLQAFKTLGHPSELLVINPPLGGYESFLEPHKLTGSL